MSSLSPMIIYSGKQPMNNRGHSICYSKYTNIQFREFNHGDPTNYEDYSHELDGINKKLEDLRNKTIQGRIVRSKARWYGADEKSTSWFINLENYSNKSVKELQIYWEAKKKQSLFPLIS